MRAGRRYLPDPGVAPDVTPAPWEKGPSSPVYTVSPLDRSHSAGADGSTPAAPAPCSPRSLRLHRPRDTAAHECLWMNLSDASGNHTGVLPYAPTVGVPQRADGGSGGPAVQVLGFNDADKAGPPQQLAGAFHSEKLKRQRLLPVADSRAPSGAEILDPPSAGTPRSHRDSE